MFGFQAKDVLKSCEKGSGCCTPQPKAKELCPKCQQKAKGVPAITLEHLLTQKAKEELKEFEGFYFCKTASCEVVYFKEHSILKEADISVGVGLKEGVKPATLCYCFGWTKEMIEAELKAKGSSDALEDIKTKMKNPGCSCETLNPSGSCCLGDVSQAIKALEKELNTEK